MHLLFKNIQKYLRIYHQWSLVLFASLTIVGHDFWPIPDQIYLVSYETNCNSCFQKVLKGEVIGRNNQWHSKCLRSLDFCKNGSKLLFIHTKMFFEKLKKAVDFLLLMESNSVVICQVIDYAKGVCDNSTQILISEIFIEIKIKLNFYFHTSLWCLKRP